MPIGQPTRGTAAGPHVQPAVIPAGHPDPSAPLPPDSWQHFTITPDQWSAGEVVVQTTGGSRIKVLEFDAIRLYIRLDNTVTTAAGGYDLVHPGAAELDESVPSFRDVHLIASGGTPAEKVELYVLDGAYANRPS